jgi:hypothetical protein
VGDAQVGQLGGPADAEALGDEPPRVVADRERVEVVGAGDAAIKSASALGGLGGVLGDVSGDGVVGQLAVAGDGPDVELRSPDIGVRYT